MIRDHTIVCVASNWFDHPTSKHHVMRHLARHNHIVWLNYHASRRPKLTGGDRALILRRLRQACCPMRRVAEGLDVMSPLLIPLPDVPLARRLNGWLLAWQIRRALYRLPRRPLQLWFFTPDAPELIQRMGAERVVYYCVDDFAGFSGFDTQLIERLERETIAQSDVVITTSAELYEGRQDRHRCVHFVPHGVDFEHFARAPQAQVPEELAAIRGPIFGFMGLIGDYVNLELIADAARARRDWSFVLLGDVRCDAAAVDRLPNVHLLGGRPYDQLPGFCRGFDVGLIPFRMNRLTRAVNPIKLREYLAAGLPVVSSPLPEVQRYAPDVQVAETLPEFLGACERALRSTSRGDRRRRQAVVRSEGWGARIARLEHIVERLPATGRIPGSVSVGTVAGETEGMPAAVSANQECAAMGVGDAAAVLTAR